LPNPVRMFRSPSACILVGFWHNILLWLLQYSSDTFGILSGLFFFVCLSVFFTHKYTPVLHLLLLSFHISLASFFQFVSFHLTAVSWLNNL
jgi:hypothetical protein